MKPFSHFLNVLAGCRAGDAFVNINIVTRCLSVLAGYRSGRAFVNMTIVMRCLSVLAGCLFASLTLADDLSESIPVVWDKVPIPITLGIGQERMVTFSEPVEFNSEPSSANLTDEKLRVFNQDKTLYLQAEQVFDAQRVRVTGMHSGQVILLDLIGVLESDQMPLSIAFNPPHPSDHHVQSLQHFPLSEVVSLMRAAIQAVVLPAYLREPLANIRTLPLKSSGVFNGLMKQPGITALLTGHWQQGQLSVTALQLRHRLPETVTLQPLDLCGEFQAVSFYPRHTLAPAGTDEAETTVFLLSTQPFESASRGCHGID